MQYLSEVPLELKIGIAKCFHEAWFALVVYDQSFQIYAYSDKGITDCIVAFKTTKIVIENNQKLIITKLFDKSHSFNDQPALSGITDKFFYCYNSKIHRISGPAIILHGHYKWVQNNEFYRENGLPTDISPRSRRWYIGPWNNGKLHRIGGPAMIIHQRPDCYWLEWYENGERVETTHLNYINGQLSWHNHSPEEISAILKLLPHDYNPETDPMWLHDMKI